METFRKNNELVIAFIILLILSFPIYFFNSIYLNGDQVLFRQAYELVEGLNFMEGLYIYNGRLDGYRFPPLTYTWVTSSLGINKDISATFLNIIFASYVYIYLRKINVNKSICFIILFTNYYFWALYTTMEQVRVAFIFFTLSQIYKDKLILFIIFSILSLISHQSLLFIYFGIFSVYLFQKLDYRKINVIDVSVISLTLIFSLFFMIYFYSTFKHKFGVYFNEKYIFEIKNYIPCLILFIFSMVYSKKIIIPILCFIPFFLGIMLIGPTRLNMLAYFTSLYFVLEYKNGNNLFFYLTSSYLGYKSILYLNSIYHHGHGFHG